MFEQFLEKSLRWEGGWSDDPVDHGGKTQLGITQQTLSVWLGRPATDQEIRSLTRDQAVQIYRVMYFERPRINLLPEFIQGQVFDFGVNAGPARAIRYLQVMLNRTGLVQPPLSLDGQIGSLTLNQIGIVSEQIPSWVLVNAYQDERQNFYRAVVQNDPSQSRFIQGWTNRVNDWRVPETS